MLIGVLEQQALAEMRLARSAGAISESDAALTFALISKELERDLDDLNGASERRVFVLMFSRFLFLFFSTPHSRHPPTTSFDAHVLPQISAYSDASASTPRWAARRPHRAASASAVLIGALSTTLKNSRPCGLRSWT